MNHYLFTERTTGEDFIVGADTLFEAYDMAFDYFEVPAFLRQISEFEAEASGLDEY